MSYIAPFISFFTIISVVLFGSHVFLYFAIRHFFSPGDVARRNIAIVLGLLSVSFIVASTVAHWYDTVFSRGLYYGSAVWLGVLSNAFFVFAILWVLGGILSLARFPLAPLKMGWTGIVIIILSSLYGLSNAADPVVREETVYIRNLPAEWEGKKIVQITDVHLGHIVRSDFARRIVDMSNAVRPAAIFIVGDLLDGMDGHLDGLVEPFNDLRSQYGTYFVTGNHETYLGTGETMDAIRRTNIRTLDDAMADLGGVQLVGIAFPER